MLQQVRKQTKKRSSRTVMCVALFAVLPLENSYATSGAAIKVESNGFLRRSADRSDSSTTISAGPRLFHDGESLESRLDADFMVQITDTKNLSVDRSSIAYEATNAYLATGKTLLNEGQFTFGRRVYDWSKFDKEWDFGAISPRFIWDPMRPQIVGLTGIFYVHETTNWRLAIYGSPLSIPERGYPLRNENGKLLSSNPFYNPYFDSAVIAKKNIPVQYTIDMPPLKDLVFKAGGMVSARYSTEAGGKGYWTQALYGFLPILQPNLAVEPKYDLVKDVIDVKIHPAIQRHHVAMLEAGITENAYSIWGSITGEKPTRRDVPANWISTRSEAATILSAGGHLMLAEKWKLKGSYIYVSEERTPTTETPDFTVDLPGRFPYHRAARVSLDFQATERMSYMVSAIADLEFDSQLMSADITYQVLKADSALTLNLGSDFFASATNKGYIGQYKGNDRFRGGIGYAF